MTSKERAAMKQALGALEAAGYGGSYAAIDLREALAEQAEQEPVCIDWDTKTDEPIMGYAAPVRTKDLTDDEISKIWDDSSYGDSGIDFARAVIAADREKNNAK